MGWFDKLRDKAVKNSQIGGPISMTCATMIQNLEMKRAERKIKKLEEKNRDKD